MIVLSQQLPTKGYERHQCLCNGRVAAIAGSVAGVCCDIRAVTRLDRHARKQRFFR